MQGVNVALVSPGSSVRSDSLACNLIARLQSIRTGTAPVLPYEAIALEARSKIKRLLSISSTTPRAMRTSPDPARRSTP